MSSAGYVHSIFITLIHTHTTSTSGYSKTGGGQHWPSLVREAGWSVSPTTVHACVFYLSILFYVIGADAWRGPVYVGGARLPPQDVPRHGLPSTGNISTFPSSPREVFQSQTHAGLSLYIQHTCICRYSYVLRAHPLCLLVCRCLVWRGSWACVWTAIPSLDPSSSTAPTPHRQAKPL
jgi:hypothetical protein